jgi:hypothetical protein
LELYVYRGAANNPEGSWNGKLSLCLTAIAKLTKEFSRAVAIPIARRVVAITHSAFLACLLVENQ